MSHFFKTYNKNTNYNVKEKQEFDNALNSFLGRNRSYYSNIDINQEFAEIENFLSFQYADFFEETFLTTSSKIIQHFSTFNFDEAQISSAQIFINILKKEKFKDLFPKLQNYGTNHTFNFIFYLLNNNNIILAENITKTFIHPEKRTLKSFSSNVVEWCLKNTKIAALKFLIHNYDGFNAKNIQSLFLSYAELGEEYLSKVFPDNIYPNSLESDFQSFFNNSSIVLFKKLELISYFSQKTDFVPKELVSFIKTGLIDNSISVESLKKHDFFPKLTAKETLNNFLSFNTNNYVVNMKSYLSFFDKKENIAPIIFNLLTSNFSKDNYQTILVDFIKEFPEFSKENSDDIKKYIVDNNLDIGNNLFASLKSGITIDSDFTDYLINKQKSLFFKLKTPSEDSDYIDKAIKYMMENGSFPEMPNLNLETTIFNKMLKQLGNDKLAELFFIKNSGYNFVSFLKKANATLVIDVENMSEHTVKTLLDGISSSIRRSVIDEFSPKKWYQFSYEKPLQLVYKNSEFIVIKKVEDKVIVQEQEFEEELNSNSFSLIISQAKKDLNKFNQLTSQPLDFNLEFKIRSESIFLQQMNFLNQIQKIEKEMNIEDLFFLKNNLGKYLIQCTETYSRALVRYQTLLENPGLFKKQDNTLESQKEKIDNEALKQVSLLEKELNYVKENIIKTLNSDSVSDMRVNTRFLEATVEHSGEDSIVKLVARPK